MHRPMWMITGVLKRGAVCRSDTLSACDYEDAYPASALSGPVDCVLIGNPLSHFPEDRESKAPLRQQRTVVPLLR